MSDAPLKKIEGEAAVRQARVSHLIRISGNLSITIMALWGNSPRAEAMLGMCEASLRWSGPDDRDDEVLRDLRNLFTEACDHREAGDFPATMARLRVAYDMVSLATIRAAGQ